MRLGRTFIGAALAVEALTSAALGIVAHRFDVWLDWQTGLAPMSLAAGVAALGLQYLRGRGVEGPSTTRMHRYVEETPDVGGSVLTQRIRTPAELKVGHPLDLALTPHRHDGPIEGTNRP
ncbi:MAG: hypothetical protein AUH85_18570 [Chloroflexi bacterium 13_1_40CM_4_68_4]|nr:MAG: hypothetical protein AUH85_18570 [Chloroflexi bacterium 13_1_40CM_4_68_4]